MSCFCMKILLPIDFHFNSFTHINCIENRKFYELSLSTNKVRDMNWTNLDENII